MYDRIRINKGHLLTPWADKVGEIPLPEYPRPQLVRKEWQNLNGMWRYEVVDKEGSPSSFDAEIRVPFCIESYLSGVGRVLTPDEELWYTRELNIPNEWSNRRIILHFGAVDWKTTVYMNDREVGTHIGGYNPFSFDITDYLDDTNELKVRVWDPTDSISLQHGKQKLQPGGIFYTPSSGIWQTVWMEPVHPNGVKKIKLTPNIDTSSLTIEIDTYGSKEGLHASISSEFASLDHQDISSEIQLSLSEFELWSPDNPILYDLEIKIFRGDEELDSIISYFGMRKFSMDMVDGYYRPMLNNSPIFHLGTLDQGYWPDGIVTAPTDEALEFDVIKTKELGFNVIRKHIKVEPLRWYHHCDRHGIIVWQDMVSGGDEGIGVTEGLELVFRMRYSRKDNTLKHYKRVNRMTQESRDQFRTELKEMVDTLHNVVSIAIWVPFNEGWGQFNANEIGQWLMEYDPSRLVDVTSGFNLQDGGHIRSWHIYIRKLKMLEKKVKGRIVGISEAGGYSLKVKEHVFDYDNKSFFYGSTKTGEALLAKYLHLINNQTLPLVKRGLSTLIYTQTTDVEFEVNGLYTYDRKVLKMDEEIIKEANNRLINSVLRV
ncbi:MAG: beta-galactosidase [Candidatus Heimdallarchaeota archaeon]|nr:beta-galactosidase [Candidatus Heimdallarchaeota archaeon]